MARNTDKEFAFLLKAAANYDPAPNILDHNTINDDKLRALWTAYCLHNRIPIASDEYAVKLISIYDPYCIAIRNRGLGFESPDFESFAEFMGELFT